MYPAYSQFSPRLRWDPDHASDNIYRSLKLYLPSNEAGAAPIQPTPDAFWTDTNSYESIRAQLNRKIGTNMQDISIAVQGSGGAGHTASTHRPLFRQWVCPLDHSGIYDYKHAAAALLGVAGMCLAKLNTSITPVTVSPYGTFQYNVNVWVITYLVDGSGGHISQERRITQVTLDPVDVPNVDSAGQFVPGDVGQGFAFVSSPNLVFMDPVGSDYQVGGSIATVSAYHNSSQIEATQNLGFGYANDIFGGGDEGTNKEMWMMTNPGIGENIYTEKFNMTKVTSNARVWCAGTPVLSPKGFSTRVSRDMYLVIEVGAMNCHTADRTLTLRVGDPTDTTQMDDYLSGASINTGHSSGGFVELPVYPRLITR